MRRRVNRRHFLGGAATAAGALMVPGAHAASGLKARLGVTGDEIAPDLETALRVLRELGLGWIELRNVWGKYITDVSLADCKRARALMDRQKVKVSVLDTALYKCDLPGLPSGRKEDYPYAEQDAVLGRALERAPLLGTRFVRVFSFWRPGAKGHADVTGQIVAHLGKAAERAKAAGCMLLLENVNGANVETGAEAARLLAALPSAALGLAWDPNNAYCGAEIPFPDGYDKLDKKRIHHVHLRDAGHDPQSGKCVWLPVGKGKVDNLGLLRALVKDGFTGTLTLETHYQRPDKNKELATRESLAGLLAVLDRV
jgi:L-ribulose-5-phosphate 3-epimerase